jgi:hypothetical protein
MLVSLLLGQDGQLIAGGLACDQLPMGNHYWREVLGVTHPRRAFDETCETAVVEIGDQALVDQILSYHLDPDSQQLQSIMAKLEQPLRSKRRVIVPRFAA